jgi:hypothetical protein
VGAASSRLTTALGGNGAANIVLLENNLAGAPRAGQVDEGLVRFLRGG